MRERESDKYDWSVDCDLTREVIEDVICDSRHPPDQQTSARGGDLHCELLHQWIRLASRIEQCRGLSEYLSIGGEEWVQILDTIRALQILISATRSKFDVNSACQR